MKFKYLKTILIGFAVSTLPTVCFAANNLEKRVNSVTDYMLAGFLALLKLGGTVGLIGSIIFLLLTQDSDAIKKLKIAVVFTGIAAGIGWGASAIVGDILV